MKGANIVCIQIASPLSTLKAAITIKAGRNAGENQSCFLVLLFLFKYFFDNK